MIVPLVEPGPCPGFEYDYRIGESGHLSHLSLLHARVAPLHPLAQLLLPLAARLLGSGAVRSGCAGGAGRGGVASSLQGGCEGRGDVGEGKGDEAVQRVDGDLVVVPREGVSWVHRAEKGRGGGRTTQ